MVRFPPPEERVHKSRLQTTGLVTCMGGGGPFSHGIDFISPRQGDQDSEAFLRWSGLIVARPGGG